MDVEGLKVLWRDPFWVGLNPNIGIDLVGYLAIDSGAPHFTKFHQVAWLRWWHALGFSHPLLSAQPHLTSPKASVAPERLMAASNITEINEDTKGHPHTIDDVIKIQINLTQFPF